MRRYLSSRGCFRGRVMKAQHMNPHWIQFHKSATVLRKAQPVKVWVPWPRMQLPAGPGPKCPRCAYRSSPLRLLCQTQWMLFSKVDQDNFLQGPPQEDYMVKNWPESMTLPRTINPSARHQAGFVPFSTFSCVLSIFRSMQHNPLWTHYKAPQWWSAQSQRSVSLLLPALDSQYE